MSAFDESTFIRDNLGRSILKDAVTEPSAMIQFEQAFASHMEGVSRRHLGRYWLEIEAGMFSCEFFRSPEHSLPVVPNHADWEIQRGFVTLCVLDMIVKGQFQVQPQLESLASQPPQPSEPSSSDTVSPFDLPDIPRDVRDAVKKLTLRPIIGAPFIAGKAYADKLCLAWQPCKQGEMSSYKKAVYRFRFDLLEDRTCNGQDFSKFLQDSGLAMSLCNKVKVYLRTNAVKESPARNPWIHTSLDTAYHVAIQCGFGKEFYPLYRQEISSYPGEISVVCAFCKSTISMTNTKSVKHHLISHCEDFGLYRHHYDCSAEQKVKPVYCQTPGCNTVADRRWETADQGKTFDITIDHTCAHDTE